MLGVRHRVEEVFIIASMEKIDQRAQIVKLTDALYTSHFSITNSIRLEFSSLLYYLVSEA